MCISGNAAHCKFSSMDIEAKFNKIVKCVDVQT
jgi:hypothetical protein